MFEDFEFKGNKNPKIVASDDDTLKFLHGESSLKDEDEFHRFIKSCEERVRKDPRYDNYIFYLKSHGYNRDVFQGGIDNEKYPNTSIEMHHALLNLYEICSIVTDHLLAEGEKVNTFKVADRVLTEHELGNVVTVMLTKTNHEEVHNGNLFFHISQTTGDLLTFIKKYKKGFHKEHVYILTKYLELCDKYDATDNDYLVTRKAVEKIKENIEKYN